MSYFEIDAVLNLRLVVLRNLGREREAKNSVGDSGVLECDAVALGEAVRRFERT